MSLPFAQLDLEAWLVKRLGEHGARVFDGLTTTEGRRELFRGAIVDHGLSSVLIGRGADGKSETYAQAFARIYGQPLETVKAKRSECAA